MAKLIHLDLAHTNVAALDTSAFLELELLDLRATQVSDETLSSISPIPRLRTLDLSGTPERRMHITDKGLVHIVPEKFPQLTRLILYDTQVTAAGVDGISARFPGIGVYWEDPKADGSVRVVLPQAPPPGLKAAPQKAK
jgi:hypothetical protein